MTSTHKTKAIVIFVIATSFYLYEYILQVAPSVMAHPIMQSFGIGAAGLGTISAFYFYSYAPMQLPAGLLFDCYGPRRLITTAILFCAMGACFFALTQNVVMASIGRFLIGIGSAFSFIGIVVLVSRWFPAKQFALMTGIAQMGSSIGAILGELPLAKLTQLLGWRLSMFVLAILGVVLSVLAWCIVQDTPYATKPTQRSVKISKEWRKLLVVLHHRQTWWVAIYAFSSWTSIAVFAALWGVPYLMCLYQTSTAMAALACTMVWLGIGIGSPFFGWFSDKINNRRIPLALTMLIGFVVSVTLLFVGPVSWLLMYLLLFMLGLSASGQTLSFALVKENNRPEYVGTASGFNNLSVLIGGALFQPLFGYILYASWDGKMQNSMPVYSVEAYRLALMMLPCFFILGLVVICFFIKEPVKKKG